MVFPVPGPLAFTVANCLLRRRSRAEKTPPPPPLTRTSLPPATGPPANEDALPLAQFQDHETHFGFLYLTTRCCDLHLPYCLPSLPSASAFPRVDASSARPPHLPPARSPRCPASDPHVFLVSAASLGIKGVWIKLPIEFANLVEAAVKEGFWFHHAEPNYLMLVCWLPDIKHTIPINASHRVGIGALVMNDKREVLVVQEKNGRFRGSGLWKFPMGVIDQGEDIHTGAIREVKEETGIDPEFVEVIAFSQSHTSFFEKSDLSFICMLRPLSHDINPQESEIEAAKWMPMEEYAAQPFVQKHELVKNILNISLARMDNSYAGFSSVGVKSAFFDRVE